MPFAASTTASPSGFAQRSSIARARAVDVEGDLAAEEVARVEPAEHEVRVGDGRLGAAAAVADRPGIGARALRPDAQQAARVDPGDRAAAGADLDQVDDRRPHRVAGERQAADPGARVAADVVVLRHRRPAVLDQADLGGRAAHVEREDVRSPERRAECGGRDHARGRARLDHEHRPRRAASELKTPPLDCITSSFASIARLGEALLDALQVALDDRADHGVDHGRRGAQVLAELGRHLGRERDRHARQLLGEDRADPLLVLRVDVRVEQADRDRLDAARAGGARPPRGPSRRRAASAPRPRPEPLATPTARSRGTSGGAFSNCVS